MSTAIASSVGGKTTGVGLTPRCCPAAAEARVTRVEALVGAGAGAKTVRRGCRGMAGATVVEAFCFNTMPSNLPLAGAGASSLLFPFNAVALGRVLFGKPATSPKAERFRFPWAAESCSDDTSLATDFALVETVPLIARVETLALTGTSEFDCGLALVVIRGRALAFSSLRTVVRVVRVTRLVYDDRDRPMLGNLTKMGRLTGMFEAIKRRRNGGQFQRENGGREGGMEVVVGQMR